MAHIKNPKTDELLLKLDNNLSTQEFSEVQKFMIRYIFDILIFDGTENNWELTSFQLKLESPCNIDILFVLNTKTNGSRLYDIEIIYSGPRQYEISLTAQMERKWTIHSVIDNYVNTIGLLLHPNRLLKFENVQPLKIQKV